MILQSFFTFVLAIAAGFGLAHLLWRDDRGWAFLLKFFLGIGLGLGITSCLYFLRLLLFPGQGGYLLMQVGFLILVLIALFYKGRLSVKLSFKPISTWQVLLGLASLLVLGFTTYTLLLSSRISPHGDYDAQAIWNLRARFIYRLGSEWKSAFSPDINRNFHMDYPLLVPLNVVGGWNALEGEVLRVPAVQSMLFLIGLAGLTYSALAYMRSSSQASIAMIILLATPFILLYSTFQTADIPLSYFFLASGILLLLSLYEDSRSLLFLCGLAAGLSAWTKNEGISLALIIALLVLVIHFSKREWAGIFSFLGGMALPLLTILLFKLLLPAGNDLLTESSPALIVQKIMDPVRPGAILSHLKSELALLGGWPISIVLLLALYGLLLGKFSDPQSSYKPWILLIIVAAQFSTYILVYLITPNDLEWQLTYSLSRLLIHLYPLALVSFFLFVRSPEQIGKPHSLPLENKL